MMTTRAYLDIETTGLSRRYGEITVIGIAREVGSGCRVAALVEDGVSEAKLLAALKGVDRVYTYNGNRFDLPFIKARLGVDLRCAFRHTDLMYACWKQDLKGGLKAVERKLRIGRATKGIDGFMAVRLWWDYKNHGNQRALQRLLDYNREDVVNLRLLREKLQVA